MQKFEVPAPGAGVDLSNRAHQVRSNEWRTLLFAFVCWFLFLIVAVAIAAIPLLNSWRYGISIAGSTVDPSLHGAAFIALEVGKLVLIAGIGELWRRTRIVAYSCIAACLVLTGFSLWSAFSVELQERGAITAKFIAAERLAEAHRADLSRLENKLQPISATRPVGVVQADLSAFRNDWRWIATKDCTDTTKSIGAYCREHHRLFAELAGAEHSSSLRAKIASVRAQQSAPASLSAHSGNDELKVIASIAGLDIQAVTLLRAIVFALGLELVSSAMIAAASALRPRISAARLSCENLSVRIVQELPNKLSTDPSDKLTESTQSGTLMNTCIKPLEDLSEGLSKQVSKRPAEAASEKLPAFSKHASTKLPNNRTRSRPNVAEA